MRCARMMLIAAVAALAQPALAVQVAIGNATHEDFEGYALGPKSIDICPGTVGSGGAGFDCGYGVLLGGSIVAVAGGQAYAGTDMGLSVTDPVDLSIPGMRALVSSGDAAVTLTVFAYDYDLGSEMPFYTDTLGPGQAGVWMGIGTEASPVFITRFRFASQASFTIDDLQVGLENIAPGIPEPASWALLMLGFGATGSIMRRQRHLA